jgi:PKD repeat protein
MKYQLNKPLKEIVLKGMVICLILFLFQFIGVPNSQALPTTYTWNTTVGNFNVAGNWSPARNSPAADDILTFNGSLFSISTVTAVPAQYIGQLSIINNCTTMLISTTGITLTVGTTDISNSTCALFVASSCQLIFGGSKAITLALNSTYSVGTVNGDIVFAQTSVVTTALTSFTTNGIVFTSGASFQNAPTAYVQGSPFSGSTVNSVEFQAGSVYYMAGTKTAYSQGTTGDPFFSTRPASIINFLSGSSCYIWNPQTGLSTFAGRTVGYAIFDNRAKTYSIAGSAANGFIVIQNDFIFKGTAISAVSTVNQGGIRVGGNFIVESGSAGFWDCELGNTNPTIFEVMGNMSCAGTFVCNTATNGAVTTYNNRCYLLDGTSPQTLYLGNNIATFGQLSINNAAGINLLSNLSVETALFMNNGNINTNGYTLSLGSSIGSSVGVLSHNATNNPWIIGNFQRWVPSGSAVAYGFPVGASHYDGATVDFSGSAPSGGGYLAISFTSTNPGDNNVLLGPDSSGNIYYVVSSSGYWTINNGVTLSGNPNLWLVANDITGLPSPISEAGIVESSAVYPSSASWTITGSSISNNTGTLIESAGLVLPSGTSYYDIASPTTTFYPPSAGFYSSTTGGDGPLTVTFMDTTLHNPTSWNWNFGDGIGTSTSQDPTYIYETVGAPTTYIVTLIATNNFGSSTATGMISIFVTETAPSAGFRAYPTSGSGPLTVFFTDTSLNGPTSWSWNFGDGIGTSTSQDPSYTYAAVVASTTYSVTLIATNNFGSGTATGTVWVSVAGPTRFLWCWNNDSITNNIGTARTDLFNFCAAPFGDTTQAVTVLYYYGEDLIPGSNTNLRSFLQQAHAQGLKVLYLDGDPSWVTSSGGVQTAESFVTTVITFNEQTSDPTQRFDGIQMDIEPGSASGWTNTQADTTYWNNFITILSFDESQVSTYNLSYSPNIYFESIVESEDWSTQGPVPNYQQVQNICDSVAIEDYRVTVSLITTNALGEISYADSISKKIVVGVETGNYGATVSFHGLGDYAMESVLTIADAVFSTHSSYRGNAIDDLDTYKDLSCSCAPIAYCWGNVTTGAGPLTVIFTDGSGNTPTSWNWSFGDGSTSTVQTPTHTYGAVSVSTSYTVSLIVSNGFGTSTATRINYIQVTPATLIPNAGFYGIPTTGNGPLTVYFTDTSANNPSSWNWTFGDGSTSTLENPTTIYPAAANATSYTVTLVATNAYGSSTSTLSNYIYVTNAAPFQGGIIWDWDSTATTPVTALKSGYLYVYNYTGAPNTHGINGSGCLIVDAPYQTGVAPHRKNGGAIWLSNIPGWTVGAVGMNYNNINLSGAGNSTVYFSVMANQTSTFGVAFAPYDTSGNFFVDTGAIYIADSTNPTEGNISTTAFQEIKWPLKNFHVYEAGKKKGYPPALANINAFEWFFAVPSGTPSGSPTLQFYIDNVGAGVNPSTPVELLNFEAVEAIDNKNH